MQVFLSRAATARTSCRCFSCGQAAKTVTRQNVNATKRRRVGANDVFTACYSSLMASAVIADAEIKKSRRQKWDLAIAEARSGPVEADTIGNDQELGEKTYTPISAPSASVVQGEGQYIPQWCADTVNPGDLSSVSITQGGRKLQIWKRRIQDNLEGGDRKYGCQEESDIVALVANDEVLGDEEGENEALEWVDERPLPGIPFRTPVRRVHVDKAEDAVKHLVAKILQNISIYNLPDRLKPDHEFYKAQQVLDTISKLQDGFSRFPNYEFRNEKAYASTRNELHTSFYKICQQATQDKHEIDWMLAKICYNLLVSPVPPSIITYNILLGELHRLKQHDVAEVIIQTYFKNTRLSPTFDTLRLMLDHYVEKQDFDGFQLIRNRMRGVAMDDQNQNYLDMRFGRRRVQELYDPFVQTWARQHKHIIRNKRIIRRSPRDEQVFNSLIMGSLSFGSTRQAIRIFGDAAAHIEVRSDWVCSIASACLARFDHRGAQRLFRYLMEHWRNSTGEVFIHLSRDVRLAVQQIMALIGVDFSNAAVPFPKLHFLHMYEKEAHIMLLDMYLERAKEQIDRLSRAIAELQSVLGLNSNEFESTEHEISSFRSIDSEITEYEAEQASLANMRVSLRNAQLSFINRRVWDSVGRSRKLCTEVNEAMAKLTLVQHIPNSTPAILQSPLRNQERGVVTRSKGRQMQIYTHEWKPEYIPLPLSSFDDYFEPDYRAAAAAM